MEELMPARSWSFVGGGAPLGYGHGSSSRKRNWALMAWSLFAATVDILLAFSLTCFFAVIFIAISGVNPGQFSQFVRASFVPGLGVCFILVFSSYLLFFRLFAGCTMGEWACGIRLGEPHHRMSNQYSLKVVQRFFIVALTGGVILPVLSMMLGKDLAGKISGLPLVIQVSR